MLKAHVNKNIDGTKSKHVKFLNYYGIDEHAT